jgi:hypothetical protein
MVSQKVRGFVFCLPLTGLLPTMHGSGGGCSPTLQEKLHEGDAKGREFLLSPTQNELTAINQYFTLPHVQTQGPWISQRKKNPSAR